MTKTLASIILSLPRVQFAGFDYQSQETGELARFSVILGGSTEAMYKRDLAILERWEAKRSLLAPIFQEAVTAIADSRRKSLAEGIGQREDYTNRETYDILGNGLKVHKVTSELYVTGLRQSKVVIVAGTERKIVNSKPLTLAKRTIESRLELPSRKFRTFKLAGVKGARVDGETLVLY